MAVETAFAKTSRPAGAAQALSARGAQKFKKELIKVLLLNEKGEEEACTWKVQRAKITPKGIQELIGRARGRP